MEASMVENYIGWTKMSHPILLRYYRFMLKKIAKVLESIGSVSYIQQQ